MIARKQSAGPAARRWVDGPAVAGQLPAGAAGVTRQVAGQGPPPDHAAGTAADFRPHHDQVTAVHDAIDFARALVQDGGVNTAGLTMLRAEVGHLQREVHAWRQELAATRQDVDRLRADLLRATSWTRGTLVDRLAAKFAEIDATLARAATGLAGQEATSGRDTAQMRAGHRPPDGMPSPGEGGDCPPPPPPGSFGR